MVVFLGGIKCCHWFCVTSAHPKLCPSLPRGNSFNVISETELACARPSMEEIKAMLSITITKEVLAEVAKGKSAGAPG